VGAWGGGGGGRRGTLHPSSKKSRGYRENIDSTLPPGSTRVAFRFPMKLTTPAVFYYPIYRIPGISTRRAPRVCTL
jgi:hypothetical protein